MYILKLFKITYKFLNNLINDRGLLFLLLVPLFSFFWHFENLQMPISDSVEYLDSAYSIYLFFDNGEYLNFIISIFNERVGDQ